MLPRRMNNWELFYLLARIREAHGNKEGAERAREAARNFRKNARNFSVDHKHHFKWR